MFITLIDWLLLAEAALAVAAFTIAICNSVKIKRVKNRMKWLQDDVDWYYNYFNKVYDRLDNMEDFADDVEEYLHNLEESINHNVDMTNFTLNNFKRAIENDRKEIKNLTQVWEIHQTVLEDMHDALDLMDKNLNDTLDVVEDMVYADWLEECEDEPEYFEEEKKEKKSSKKQK